MPDEIDDLFNRLNTLMPPLGGAAPSTFDDVCERFNRLMPKTDDLTLVVLKSHLLIEEQFNELIDWLFVNPKAMRARGLRFFDRINIVRACFAPTDRAQGCFDLVERLNTIRNKIAHHVEHPDVERLIDEFIRDVDISAYKEQWAEYESRTVAARLSIRAALIYSRLLAIRTVAPQGVIRYGTINLNELFERLRAASSVERSPKARSTLIVPPSGLVEIRTATPPAAILVSPPAAVIVPAL